MLCLVFGLLKDFLTILVIYNLFRDQFWREDYTVNKCELLCDLICHHTTDNYQSNHFKFQRSHLQLVEIIKKIKVGSFFYSISVQS